MSTEGELPPHMTDLPPVAPLSRKPDLRVVAATTGANGSAPPPSGRASATMSHIECSARSLHSAVRILEHNLQDVLDGRRLEYNEMLACVTLNREPVSDVDITSIAVNIEKNIFTPKGKPCVIVPQMVEKALALVAAQRQFHPIREWLRASKWDGRPRIEGIADDILGASYRDDALERTMIRKFLVSAVARVMRPGCKADCMLVLCGPQGAGKSTFFKILAGEEWHADTAFDLNRKDAFLVIRSTWLFEWAELEVLRRARDAAAVKGFLSSTSDRFVPPYGRHAITAPRTCVVVGTTNEDDFLTDTTGNRRFWPVIVRRRVNRELLLEQRDQIWAEAVAAYDAGETWWLDDNTGKSLADVHDNHFSSDAWEEPVLRWAWGWLAKSIEHLKLPADLQPTPFMTSHVLEYAIQKPRGQWTRADEMRVAAILRRAGWRLGSKPYATARLWEPPDAPDVTLTHFVDWSDPRTKNRS